MKRLFSHNYEYVREYNFLSSLERNAQISARQSSYQREFIYPQTASSTILHAGCAAFTAYEIFKDMNFPKQHTHISP
jgi:hypothetical protein